MRPITNPSASFMARNMTIYHQTHKASPERREARELTARVGKRQARYAIKMMRHMIKQGASDIYCAFMAPGRAMVGFAPTKTTPGFTAWATTPRHQVTLPPEMA